MSWEEAIGKCMSDQDFDELAPLSNVIPIRQPLPDTDAALEGVRQCRVELAEAQKWFHVNERLYTESADELAACKSALQLAVYVLLQSLEVEK